MKKIGILTFHCANNIGAVLQASALCQYLNEHFYECEIIDYIPNNLCANQDKRFISLLKRAKRHFYYSLHEKEAIKVNRFDEYRNREYKQSKKIFYGDCEITNAAGDYSVLISGSDQILNTSLSGSSKAYYLFFDENVKKISYASSFGREKISDEEKRLVKNELRKFEALSFREQSGKSIVEQITGIKGSNVVDPVFLLSSDDWKKKAKCQKLNKGYIFVYSMEESSVLVNAVSILHQKTGLNVIAVLGGGALDYIDAYFDKCCGPREFLGYIQNAKYVITNSFHGTAFSILLGKEFICVPHSSRNTRLSNILKATDNEEKFANNLLSEDTYDNYLIDGKEAYQRLIPLIDNSKDYLRNAIEGDI